MVWANLAALHSEYGSSATWNRCTFAATIAGLSHDLLDHPKTGLHYPHLKRYSSDIESRMSWLLSHGMFVANATYLSMISSDLTESSFFIITRVNFAHSILVFD